MKTVHPETSIVIRTFNEESSLPALMKAIATQTYQDFETLVVDSGSYDRTTLIAQEFGARLIKINSEDFTFGYSLNVGIKNANGKYIVIVSAHTEPLDDTWLEKLIAPLKRSDVAMTYGKQVGNEISKYSEIQDFKRTYGNEPLELTNGSYFANNANSAINKNLWEEHPFDESLAGLEDLEWAQHWTHRDYKIVYEPQAGIYHIHDESWRQVYRRFFREAVAAHIIGIKNTVHIPGIFFDEISLTLRDVVRSLRDRVALKSFYPILAYRTMKYLATFMGIVKGKMTVTNVEGRQSLYFSNKSSAVIFHEPGRATIEQVDTPTPNPSEVLIKVAYEGVCGTDLEIYHGNLGYYKNGMASYPIVPGHELSGWVTRVGANVKDLEEGDRVVVECIQSCGKCSQCKNNNWIACEQRKEVGVMRLNGGYAEYIVTPARFVHKIPEKLDMKKAALCEPLAVVIKGVKKLEKVVADVNGEGNKKYVVIGAGPIGHFCAKLLAMNNKKVLVFDRHSKRLECFSDPLIEIEPDLEKICQESIFVEATGDPNILHKLVEGSPAGSIFLLLGLPYSRREFDFQNIVAFDKTIIGSVGSSFDDFDAALEILPGIDTEPFLQNIIPLSDFEKAWESCKQGQYLKTILEVNSDQYDLSGAGHE